MIIKVIDPKKQGRKSDKMSDASRQLLSISQRGFVYLLHYHDRLMSELCHTENIIGHEPNELAAYFNYVSERGSGRVKDPVFHAVISFAYDEIDPEPEVMETIARMYLQKMGYAKQPWVLYRHTDKQHIHYHIISNRIDIWTGKAISSSFEGKRTVEILRVLAPLFGYHIGKMIPPNKEQQGELNYAAKVKPNQQQTGLVAQINSMVQRAFIEEQPYSMYRFKQACELKGLELRKMRQGYVVKFENSYPIALSKLPIFMEKTLSKRLQEQRQFRGSCMRHIHRSLWQVLKLLPAMDAATLKKHEAEFSEKLREHMSKQGITVIYNTNSAGIAGLSFEYLGVTIKGSAMKISWASILKLMSNMQAGKQATKRTHVARKTMHVHPGRTLVAGGSVGRRMSEDDEEKKQQCELEQS